MEAYTQPLEDKIYGLLKFCERGFHFTNLKSEDNINTAIANF
tara:strand:+ start:419 stop:544 length:126 start_codon:yes stop_codon:yes gene_type:complete